MGALRILGGLVLVGALLGMASAGKQTQAAQPGAAQTTSSAQTQAAGVWVEVAPSTITAGYQVALRADCQDNSNTATVRSSAFGSVTVQPVNKLLAAEVQVPSSAKDGSHQVKLTCKSGSTATTTLLVLGKNTTPMSSGPHTGGGFLATSGHGRGAAPIWLLGGVAALLIAAALILVPALVVAPARRRAARRR